MITFGLDPEFVITSNNTPRSALKALKATQYNPVRVGDSYMYADNVLAEFRIPAVRDADNLAFFIRNALHHARIHLNPLRLEAKASEVFPVAEMDHPDSYIFGCRPEFDAWQLDSGAPTIVETPSVEPGNTLRTCGGHIHVGGKMELDDIPSYIRAMDLMVGIPSVMLNNDPTSVRRHRLYGGAGRFRVTDYGLEYRTLSNFWLARPELTAIIFNLTWNVFDRRPSTIPADVIETINTQDKVRAEQIYNTCVAQRIAPGLGRMISRAMELPLSTDLFANWGVG